MKKVVLILIIIVGCFYSYSQSITQRSSDAITVMDGNLFAKNSFRPAVFSDTTAGTISLDSCGKMIFTYSDNSYWLRACSPKRWIKILKTGDVANATWGSITGTLSNQTDLQNALNLKLNISDTTNKWVTSLYRKTASDSIFYVKGGISSFAFRDSLGSGNTNSNIGPGYRWAIPNTNNIKTVFSSNTILWDSTSNTNGLTPKVDTSVIATQFDLLQVANDTIFMTAYAWVDSLGNDGTAIINNPSKPFATIGGALDATAIYPKRVINIGIGTFDSPDSTQIISYTWFRGSGKPKPNWTVAVPSVDGDTKTNPTAMLGGTIINGSFWFNTQRLQNIIVTDLGVDVGSAWCTAHNGGNPAEGFVFTTGYVPGSGNAADGGHFLQSGTIPLQGLVVRNISSLCQSATAPVHAALFENCFAPDIDGISTYFGTHGIVFKTIGGVVSNLEAFGHDNDGIIIKSNDYANCYRLSLSNFNIGSIGVYDGAGLILDANDAGSPGLYFCNISNGTINRTKFGIRTQGSVIDGNNLSNIEVNVAQGNGVDILSGFAFGSLQNVKARTCGGIGFNIASGQMGITLNDCDAHDNTSDGFRFNAVTNANFDNINAILNDGYGINVISGNVYSGTYYTETNGSGSTTGTLIPKNPTPTPTLQAVTDVGSITTNAVSITGYSTSANKFRVGDFSLQPYGLNNGFITDNAFFNGSSWQRFNTGYASVLHFFNGQTMFENANTGSGTPTFIKGFKTDFNGHVGLGGNIDDVTYSGAKVFIDGSSGTVNIASLAGSGTRWVIVSSGGDLSTATAPVTSINSQTGTSQTIVAGTGISVNSSSNTHTISITGAGSSYNRYVALLSQSGTSDPTVTVLENTLSGTVVWTRSIAGTYFGTLSGEFISGSTWCSSSVSDEAGGTQVVEFHRNNNNTVILKTLDNTFSLQDGYTNLSIEIRIYPAP